MQCWTAPGSTGMHWFMRGWTGLSSSVLGCGAPCYAGLYWAVLVAGLGPIARCWASAAAWGPNPPGSQYHWTGQILWLGGNRGELGLKWVSTARGGNLLVLRGLRNRTRVCNDAVAVSARGESLAVFSHRSSPFLARPRPRRDTVSRRAGPGPQGHRACLGMPRPGVPSAAEFGQQRRGAKCWWWELGSAVSHPRFPSGLVLPASRAAPSPSGWWFRGGEAPSWVCEGFGGCGGTLGRTQALRDPAAARARAAHLPVCTGNGHAVAWEPRGKQGNGCAGGVDGEGHPGVVSGSG